MIATRQRPKQRINPLRYLLPLVAILALAFALIWPPSQHMIGNFVVNGPLAPVWRIAGAIASPIVTPLHFAAQEQVIADRNKAIENLNGQLEAQRKEMAARDQTIVGLQNQVKSTQAALVQAQTAPTSTPAAVVRQNAVSSSGVPATEAPPQTSDPKRAAQVWSAMDPSQAASVAKQLPPSYTAKVLALMNADSAGSVLGALPADYAARVQQAAPSP